MQCTHASASLFCECTVTLFQGLWTFFVLDGAEGIGGLSGINIIGVVGTKRTHSRASIGWSGVVGASVV